MLYASLIHTTEFHQCKKTEFSGWGLKTLSTSIWQLAGFIVLELVIHAYKYLAN